MVHIINIRK